jgi:hypothetical protein
MLGVIRAVAVVVCLYMAATTASAQPPVSSRNSYERVLAVVPLIGSGTHDDPVRPRPRPKPSMPWDGRGLSGEGPADLL